MHRILNPQYPPARAAVIKSAITHALCPAIFRPLMAAISQIIGSIASTNSNNNKTLPPFFILGNPIYEFIPYLYFIFLLLLILCYFIIYWIIQFLSIL